MEYVEGESLRRRIERGEEPTPESFRQVAFGLLDALAALHGHQNANGEASPIVHGDVKPDNVLLASNGEPKLADFSVAGPPRIDEFQGTAGYVPPDRILSEQMQFTEDGDLFALGVTLWEWLFGKKPYTSAAVGEVPATPDELPVEFPEGWRDWLARAVATTAAERFATAGEMRRALEGAEQPEPEPQQPPGAAEAPADSHTAPRELEIRAVLRQISS